MTTGDPAPAPDRGDLVNDVVIVHSDERALMDLTVMFAAMRYKVVAIDSVRPIDSALAIAERQPLAMIVSFDGTENVAEIRALIETAPNAKFLFLTPQMPARAPVARIVNAHGSTIIGQNESPAVVVGTFVALLARRSPGAV